MFFESIQFDNDNKIYDSAEGFIHGNCFINEYKSYKNYNPKQIITKTEKERLLLKIYELDFYVNDLSLFLDLHPDNQVIYDVFKRNVNNLHNIINSYEEKYGPLKLFDSNYSSFEWLNSKVPFDGGVL